MTSSLRDRFREVARKALADLFPFPCLGCRQPLPVPTPPLALCARCRALVSPPHEPTCRTCGRQVTPDRTGSVCGGCSVAPPPYYELVVAAVYAPPLDAVIQAFKYRRLRFLADDLGDLLSGRCDHLDDQIDLVVPVPLAWNRHLRRGFNQAALVADRLANTLALPRADPLRRRSRPSQVGRGRRGRHQNLRGSFMLRDDVAGARILLVDDVVTTGATVAEAARTLQANGAERVVVAVAGRTPERTEILFDTGCSPRLRSETLE